MPPPTSPWRTALRRIDLRRTTLRLTTLRRIDLGRIDPSQIHPDRIHPSRIHPDRIHPSRIHPSQIDHSGINRSRIDPSRSIRWHDASGGAAALRRTVLRRTAGRWVCAVAVAALIAGCSGREKAAPAPEPSADLGAAPVAVAVQRGPFSAGPFQPPDDGAYVGAWIKPDALTHAGRVEAVDTLQDDLGRRLDILNTYRRFDQMVGTDSDAEFLSRGANLMISWATGDNRSITSGEHDQLIRRQARAIRAVDRPVLLRMRWEMDRPNLRATMWSGADYVAAWKHVRALFREEDATNVSWVWCPTAEGFQRGDAPDFYPGDDQVDWTCVDVYAGNRFQPIGTLMGPFLTWAAQRPKPIVIGEFGVAKAWGSADRAAWLRDAQRTFKANPQIKAVVYFESDPEGNGPKQQFQLTGDTAAFSAFERLARDPYFNAGG